MRKNLAEELQILADYEERNAPRSRGTRPTRPSAPQISYQPPTGREPAAQESQEEGKARKVRWKDPSKEDLLEFYRQFKVAFEPPEVDGESITYVHSTADKEMYAQMKAFIRDKGYGARKVSGKVYFIKKEAQQEGSEAPAEPEVKATEAPEAAEKAPPEKAPATEKKTESVTQPEALQVSPSRRTLIMLPKEYKEKKKIISALKDLGRATVKPVKKGWFSTKEYKVKVSAGDVELVRPKKEERPARKAGVELIQDILPQVMKTGECENEAPEVQPKETVYNFEVEIEDPDPALFEEVDKRFNTDITYRSVNDDKWVFKMNDRNVYQGFMELTKKLTGETDEKATAPPEAGPEQK